jgi:signal transduction histidine kinase/CheY-like chemotaxis protein
MSKKNLLNRLENLFADLEQEATILPTFSEQTVKGWTWECDPQGFYIECSPEVEHILGISSVDFIGQPVTEFGLDTPSKIIIREALRSGQFPDEARVQFVNLDGRLIPASFHIFAPSSEEDGMLPAGARGFVQVIQDEPTETQPPVERPASQISPERPSTQIDLPATPTRPLPRKLQASQEPVETPLHARGKDGRQQALLQVPVKLEEDKLGLIKIADDIPGRGWSDDERRLVEQVADQLSLALENARLFQAEQRRANELNTLAEFSRLISQNLDLEEVYTTAHQLIGRLMPTESFIINLLDSQNKEFVAAYIVDKGIRQPATRFPADTGFSGFVATSGSPYIAFDLDVEPPPFQVVYQTGSIERVRSVIAVPLHFSGEIIGALSTQSYKPDAYTQHDLELLETYADHIGVAIQNARSYGLAQQAVQETRQRVQELSVLFDVSQGLASAAMETNEIANIIARRFLQIMNIPQCSVSMRDPDDNKRLRIAIDLSRNREVKANGEFYPTGRVGETYLIADLPAIMRVLENLAPLVLQADDPGLDPLTASHMRQKKIYTQALIPLAIKGEAIGVIELIAWDAPRTFTAEQLNLGLIMANAAAVAFENAKLYEEQRQTAEKLREVDKLKSQFLANMSHELRTPLNSIIGFSRVIIKGIDGPTTDLQQQDLSAIYSAGQHLLNLINDVLDISKIEAGKMELTFDNNVNLADLITSVMSTAAGLVKDKPVKLVKNVDPNLPFVRADTTRIRQVTLNLLSNAAKFTDAGSISIDAYVQDGPDGLPEVIVKVSDTGPGIAPEDQKRLFQAFTQIDETATRKAGGTGLGLSISRLLVEMHGGRIGLESEIGKGSTFYYTLPLPRPIGEATHSPGNRIVLSVDDERSILNLYDRYLSEHGYQVVPLTDPTKVVERARQIQPFAITLDVMMPGRNGWQVLEDLKNDPVTSHIPVIVCSILEDQEKGFSLGATDYLTKPILEEDLVEALSRLNSDGSIREVLVVDDDENDLRLVQRILQKDERYHIALAHGGSEGLVALRTFKPQAVILDLFMPGVDGFTILETMRADPGLRDVPVIIFTAGDLHDLTEDQQNRLAQFSQNMLQKGAFKETELLSSIEKALNRYQ